MGETTAGTATSAILGSALAAPKAVADAAVAAQRGDAPPRDSSYIRVPEGQRCRLTKYTDAACGDL